MKTEPIYEKLAPGEVLIISKTSKSVLIAANVKGRVIFQRVAIPKGYVATSVSISQKRLSG